MVASTGISLAFSPLDNSGWVAADYGARRYIARDDGAGQHAAICADGHTREDDGACANDAIFLDAGIEVESTRHVMSQNDDIVSDPAAALDMYAFWPGSVDQCAWSDPAVIGDVHSPKVLADEPLKSLAERRVAVRAKIGRGGHFCSSICLPQAGQSNEAEMSWA